MVFGPTLLAAVLVTFLPTSTNAKIAADDGILKLTQGKIQGLPDVSQNGKRHFYKYLGIPYAQPPVGKLRFSKPVPAGPWAADRVRDGTKDPPVCLQPDAIKLYDDSQDDAHLEEDRKIRVQKVPIVGKEDCLVLNVYKPDSCCWSMSSGSGDGCPVIVWLHDGSFQTSDGGPSSYGPKLIMDYNVIFVSINYRLGPMGFLSLENDDVPGNFGLWDQRLALEWVKREAKNFCGDPNRVSLMGNGAGSESTFYQMLHPAIKNHSDIFSIIAQSGSPVGDPTLKLNRPRESAIRLASRFGCTTDEEGMKCLRKADPEKLIRAGLLDIIHDPAVWIGKAILLSPWRPVIDGKFSKTPFVRDDPEVLLESGDFKSVPVIMGTTSEECVSSIAPFLNHPALLANFTETLPTLMFGIPRPKHTQRDDAVVRMIKGMYIPGGKIHRLYMPNAIYMISDYNYAGRVAKTARLLARKQDSSVFMYIYRYSMSNSMGDLTVYNRGWKFWIKMMMQRYGLAYNQRHGFGTTHGDERFIQFKPVGKFMDPMGKGPITERDFHVSKMVLWQWTTFAATGNPTPTEIPKEINLKLYTKMRGEKSARRKQPEGFTWTPLSAETKDIAEISSAWLMMGNSDYWNRVSSYSEVMKIWWRNYQPDCTDHERCKLSPEDTEAIQKVIDKYHYQLELKGFNMKEHTEL